MRPLIRAWWALLYGLFVAREVLVGALRVARAAVAPTHRITPAIVEFPLRARTDLEVSALASSITITPGTLVVGIAAATPAAPVTLFVHSVFDDDRASILDGLHDMETRLLRATRGPDRVPPVGDLPVGPLDPSPGRGTTRRSGAVGPVETGRPDHPNGTTPPPDPRGSIERERPGDAS